MMLELTELLRSLLVALLLSIPVVVLSLRRVMPGAVVVPLSLPPRVVAPRLTRLPLSLRLVELLPT